MRYVWVVAVIAALAFSGCASQGPGADCDPCASAEATPVGTGSQAAAAAASGGQRSNNAPFADDTARLAPQTTVGRGAGATTSSSADSETRHVASGGSQNLGFVVPTEARALNSGGGVSLAVQEAAKSVAAARTAYQMAACDPMCSSERLQFLADQVVAAQGALNAAQAGTTVSYITNNNFQNSKPIQIGVSTSATGKDRPIDPEVVTPLAEAAAKISEAGLAEYEENPSTPPPAPEADESLPEPPAGAVPEVPSDG